jgi:hypothetical protein
VRALTAVHDSHAVAVDGGPEEFYDLADARWSRKLFPLPAGLHRLVLRPRVAGVELDRMLLTDDYDFVPSDDASVAGVATALTLTNPVLRFALDPGYNFIAHQLSRGSNTVAELFGGLPEGTRLYTVNPATGASVENPFSAGRWSRPGDVLRLGDGVILDNPTAAAVPLTLTGTVQLNAPARLLAPGLHLIGTQQPFAGTAADLFDFPLTDGDVVHRFDHSVGEFLSHLFTAGEWDIEPVFAVGESFYLERALVP